jgi:hypothetical protein
MFIDVTDYQRARRFGSRTTMSAVDINGGLNFEPVAGATRMSWSWEVRPRGWPVRLLVRWSPAMGGVKSKGSGPGSGNRLEESRSRPNRVAIKDSWTIRRVMRRTTTKALLSLRDDHVQTQSL